MQDIKIGVSILVRADDLRVDDSVAFNVLGLIRDHRIAIRPIATIHREQAYAAITGMDLEPVAVVLQLVHPPWPARWARGNGRLTRMDEAERRIQGPPPRSTQYHAATYRSRRLEPQAELER